LVHPANPGQSPEGRKMYSVYITVRQQKLSQHWDVKSSKPICQNFDFCSALRPKC